MFKWMVWTLPVAIVFIGAVLLIIGMTIWGHYRPPKVHKGFLRITTDRGDRVYIAYISFAFFMIAWISLVEGMLYTGTGIGVALAAIILKWG
jgi:predicted small integral membrane protein